MEQRSKKLKIAIQCKDETTGKVGTFLYDPKWGLKAIGLVYWDILSLFQSEAYRALKFYNRVETWN